MVPHAGYLKLLLTDGLKSLQLILHILTHWGGKLTSLIDSVNTHTLIHDVVVDIPGRDQICDFLVSGAPVHKLYDSQNPEPESVIDSSVRAEFIKAASQIQKTIEKWKLNIPAHSGHVYLKISDPYSGPKNYKKY